MFVGLLDYMPNTDAVDWFLTDIWPRVRDAVPEARFLVVGSGAAPLLARWSQHAGVETLGFVDSLADAYAQATACVVPMRGGAGTNIKALEPFQYGRPVIATSHVLSGYDGLFQTTGGLMAVTGHPDGSPGAGPLKAGPSLVDVFTGHNAAIAVLGALNQRHRTGKGQYIDVALLDCSIAMVSHIMQDYLVSGVAPPRLGNGGNGGGPADLINCADGIIYVSAGTDEHWRLLCELMQRPDLFADPRFDTNPKRGCNRNELVAIIIEWSKHWTTADLLAALDRIGVPAARYNTLPEVWEDEQVQHRKLKVTIPHPVSGEVSLIASPLAYMSESPMRYTAPPTIGQHTDEVLREVLKLPSEDIARLHETGIV